jgi:hypothetical protein
VVMGGAGFIGSALGLVGCLEELAYTKGSSPQCAGW